MNLELLTFWLFGFFVGFVVNELTTYFARKLATNYYDSFRGGYQPDGSSKLNPVPPSGGTAMTPRSKR